jgi:hypothetical protein
MAVVATWSQPFLGKYRKPLDFEDFNTSVERPDLASRFRTRKWVRIGLWGGSLAALTATVIAASNIPKCETGSDLYHLCSGKERQQKSLAIGVGLASLGIGTALAFIPFFINPQPIEPAEARRLADEHNQKLKLKLGIAQAESPSKTPNQELALSIDLFGTAGGGGLALRASF